MAGPERAFPAVPAVFGGGRVLPSPSQFYLTGEDRLRIVSANALPGVALKLQVRTATIKGDIQAQSFDHIPNGDRTTKSTDYAVGDGSVLNCTVFAGAGAPQIGQTYVMVQLVRGIGAGAIVLGTLLGGYVTQTQALGFPGSPILTSLETQGYTRGVTGTQPAAGVNPLETCPTGAIWRVVGVIGFLATSAAAGNRSLRLMLTNGVMVPVFMGVQSVAGPSAQVQYCFSPGAVFLSYVLGGITVTTQPLSTDFWLRGGDSFTLETTGIQAGDQWDPTRYLVREWLAVE